MQILDFEIGRSPYDSGSHKLACTLVFASDRLLQHARDLKQQLKYHESVHIS